MTACTNNGGSRARRAVTAALVGVLSVGAAPMVALATEAAPVAGDVQLQDVSDEHQAFLNGTVASYTVGTTQHNGNEKVTIQKSKLSVSQITIDEVTPAGEGADTIDVPSTGSTFYYKKATGKDTGAININGEWWTYVNGWGSVTSGEYMAATTYDSSVDSFAPSTTAKYVAPAVYFTVESDSLEGVTIQQPVLDYRGNKTGETTETFTYDDRQKWADAVLVLDGQTLTASQADFEAFVKDDDGNDVALSGTDTIQAGTYKVVVKGAGAFQGEEEVLELTVNKFDLSKADLYIEDIEMGDPAPSLSASYVATDSVKGADAAAIASGLNTTYMSLDIKGNTWGSDGVGEYTYELSVKPDTIASNNVTGVATLKFNRVNAGASDVAWYYDGSHHFQNGGHIVVDASAAKDDYSAGTWTLKALDLSKFTGFYTNADGETEQFGSDHYTATIRDSEGNVVSGFSKKGVYTVTLEAKSADFEMNVKRGPISFTVAYKQGTIGTAGTTFTFDGKVVSSAQTPTYSAQDMMDRLGILVKDDKGNTLVEGTDYDVVITKDGKTVDSIVDAGKYTVSVVSDTYDITGAGNGADSIVVDVQPFALGAGNTRVTFPTAITYQEPVINSYGQVTGTRDVTFVPYTGKDITPVVEVALTTDESGDPIWTAVDASLYDLAYGYDPDGFNAAESQSFEDRESDAINAKGYYKVKVTIDAKATENYTGIYYNNQADPDNIENYAHVADTKVFVDVDNSTYYAQPIYTAVNQGYIVGLGGSNMFGPDQSITRADMVCVLYRMAGGSVDNEGVTDADRAYISDFEDVDPNAYYAKAVAWATKAGIVRGYGTTFGTERSITTEEFVTMLARYAAIRGTDTSVDADAVLAGTPDGSSVTGYAREAMAWAVESGYVGKDGNLLDPQGNVSRGRAVTIAVRYQPAQDDVVAPVEK